MIDTTAGSYAPDRVSPPGDTLAELLTERGMTTAHLARQVNRPERELRGVIQARRSIDPDLALELEHVLHLPADFWLRRESAYRGFLARRAEAKRLSTRASVLARLPVRAMIKLGWIPDAADRVTKIRHVLDFFRVGTPDALLEFEAASGTAYRRSQKLQSDAYALAAWLRYGELQAEQVDTPAYDVERFRAALHEVRALTRSAPAAAIEQARALCADAGVVLVLVPELPKARVSGAARWIAGRPVIQVSARHKTDDHLWFTFFHEAVHILEHRRDEPFLDEEPSRDEESDTVEREDPREREANEWAAEFLVPRADLRRFGAEQRRPISRAAIQSFAAKVGVSPGIVLGQLQHAGIVPYSHCHDLKARVTWAERTP